MRYRSHNPVGIIEALDDVLDLLASTQDRLGKRIRNIIDSRISEIHGERIS